MQRRPCLEVIELKKGVCATVGCEEPHDICSGDDGLEMTYLGVVAPESKPVMPPAPHQQP